jgi:hypothetical protein
MCVTSLATYRKKDTGMISMETHNSPGDPEENAREIIQIIKTRFITKEGLLARNYPVTTRTLFDNFDDIVPFFIYFDETDFLLHQVRMIREKGESLWSLCNEDGVLVSRNIDEWFGGLYALWKETGDTLTFKLLDDSMGFVWENLIQRDFLSAAFYLNKHKRATYYESWSAGLLETFCEMADDFPQAFEWAESIFKRWIHSDYFQKYSLFPYRTYLNPVKNRFQKHVLSFFPPLRSYSKPVPPLRGNPRKAFKTVAKQVIFQFTNGYYSQLMKSNSTPAFTLLEFYQRTGDRVWLLSLTQWIEAALDAFHDNGSIFMEYLPKTGLRRKPSVTPAFILVDIICDALYFAGAELKTKKSQWLSRAGAILDFQWDNRLENGLVPYVHDGSYAHLDSQVDFGISLRRYGELSDKPEYRQRALDLMNRTIEQHYSPEGYYTYSGRVPVMVIDPKYNALFLKGLISMMTIKESIYPRYHSLFKDR